MIAQRQSGVAPLVLVFAITLAGCAGTPQPDEPRQPTRQEPVRSSNNNIDRHASPTRVPRTGEKAASIALQQVGVPYRYGGANPTGFDCSGLVQYAYGRAGEQVPRTTGQLWNSAETVENAQLLSGDLLFFRIDGKMQHVGIYIGGGEFVHAPSSGKKVTTARLDSPYYRKALLRAGRLR